MEQDVLIIAAFATLLGVIFGYYFRILISLQRKESLELNIKKALFAAKERASEIIEEGERKVAEHEEKIKEEIRGREKVSGDKETRLIKKEALLDDRQTSLDQKEAEMREEQKEADDIRQEVERAHKESFKNLERISELSKDTAKKEIFEKLEKQYEDDILVRIQKIETAGQERLRRKSRDILISAIHRYGNSLSHDVMSTSVSIPSEDAKGKIIGKEGRNIRAFEKSAGVDLIIDDTPGVVVISSFDPIRRHIAKYALEKLLDDGRIHPAKIEKRVEEAQKEIHEIIKRKGTEAAYECGILNLDSRITAVLGRLHFRTSYGQNVLEHSIEMAHIAGMLAEELGADVEVAKTGALLHDIGKAADHTVSGTHVEIGRRILEKFGAKKEVIHAMQSHHEEYPYETPESVIVQVADAVSGGRPGARNDSIENYINRLGELEAIANSFEGVTRSYAIQAGREIRVFVEPESISDVEAQKMARELALRVEDELKYPGEIKISVMRETRYIEYAR